MNINRLVAPELKLPAKINITKSVERKLDNGLGLYVINSGEENVVKFEIIFPTNNVPSAGFMNSLACHQLADSGTISKKAIEIAEEFDYFGSFFQSEANADFKSFSLYSLGSLFEDSLKILDEILHSAAFRETEIQTWKQRNIQALSVNMEKVSWVAKKVFNERVFGSTHPYGYVPDIQAYEDINRDTLVQIYTEAYLPENSLMIISGKVGEKIFDAINNQFGKKSTSGKQKSNFINEMPELSFPSKVRIEKEDSVQCALRIGRQLFNKNHTDFLPLLIANTILGGYFGSRLMTNIREDKGFTYGIGSGLLSFVESGSFFISTEVGKNVLDDAVNEIYYEIDRLIKEPVPEKELLLVKNYLAGAFQRSLDGPFELAERFKGLHLYNLNYDYFDKYLHLLNEITSEEIMSVTAKYLQPSSMTQVIAG